MNAIVYTSNTGYTAQYAQLLSKKTALPAFSLDEARSRLADGSEIIYLGWVMASKIQGYAAAAKRYRIAAVCGVCMGATGSQLPEVRKATGLSDTLPVFTLQGGFDLQKLHGVYRLMMTVMVKTAGKGLADKTDRTPDEDVLLDMLQNGGSRVCEDNLKDVLDWYSTVKQL